MDFSFPTDGLPYHLDDSILLVKVHRAMACESKDAEDCSTRRRWILGCSGSGFLLAVFLALSSSQWHSPRFVAWSYGIPSPTKSKIVTFRDTHGGCTGDGQTLLIYEATSQDIKNLLNESLWKPARWQKGRKELTVWSSSGGGEAEQRMPLPIHWKDECRPYIENTNLWFALKSSRDGQNGQILIVDSENNRVVFCRWDF